MPLKFVDYQAGFNWRVDASGLPIGQVLQLGAGRWVTVCPCCGMAHDVTGVQGDVYAPNCLLKRTHPTVYAKWVKTYPEAAKHTSILLQRFEAETILTRPTTAPARAA